jgi:hypothetical protein
MATTMLQEFCHGQASRAHAEAQQAVDKVPFRTEGRQVATYSPQLANKKSLSHGDRFFLLGENREIKHAMLLG